MDIHFFRPDLLGTSKPPSPRVSGTGSLIFGGAFGAGVLARLTFVRTTDKTGGTEVVFPH
jgi:hypothetical protein